MFLLNIFKRTFNSNLKTISASGAERISLASAGVTQPTIQNYLAWRRGLLAFVVVITAIGGVLSGYREFFEEDVPGIDIFEEAKKHFSLVDPSQIDVEKAKEKIQEKVDEAKENIPDENAIEPKVREQLEENKPDENKPDSQKPEPKDEDDEASLMNVSFISGNELQEASTDEHPNAPVTPSTEDEDEEEPKTAFGVFDDYIHEVAFYILAPAALISLIFWTRFKLSTNILTAAFAFSFLVPILMTFCPWSWWGEAPVKFSADAPVFKKLEFLFDGVKQGGEYLVALLPTVLSQVPGIQKACLRIKSLLPQATLPGWLLVAVTPFNAFFLLVIFIAINQLFSDPLFLTGMLLFIAAPLLYVFRSRVLTTPLATPEDERRFKTTKQIVGILTAIAGLLILTVIVTREVFGVRLFGTDPRTSLLGPLDIAEFILEILGRSMFMTVLGADVVMRMTSASWKNTRDFETSKGASEFNDVMDHLGRLPANT